MNTTPTTSDQSNQSATAHSGRGRRRTAGLAIVAGVLAGGAIGFVTTMPGGLSAASPSSTVPAEPAAPADGNDATPDPTEHIRETLQALVDDGTITADQADAVAEHLAANRPEGRPGRGAPQGGPGGKGFGENADEFAEVLGLDDAAELKTELQSGKTIAEVAQANGVDIQTVKDYMIGQLTERLDAAVADGTIDQATADEKLAEANATIDEKINSTGPGPGRRGPGPRGPKGEAGNPGGGPNIVDTTTNTDA